MPRLLFHATGHVPEYFSGVWVTSSASQVLDSKENIKKAVDVCEEYGINHIFVVVWNNGRTLYPSRIMKDLIGVEMMEKYSGTVVPPSGS